MTLFCKKITVAKSIEMYPRLNLAESSEEGYGPERSFLSLIMITVHR
jgi:hypothetical protein